MSKERIVELNLKKEEVKKKMIEAQDPNEKEKYTVSPSAASYQAATAPQLGCLSNLTFT